MGSFADGASEVTGPSPCPFFWLYPAIQACNRTLNEANTETYCQQSGQSARALKSGHLTRETRYRARDASAVKDSFADCTNRGSAMMPAGRVA